MLIAIVNQSTLVQNSDVQLMCQAIQIQLDLHVLPAWNMKAATVQFYADSTKIPGYAWKVSVLDNSTQAGVLGYHSLDNDVVDGFIYAQPVLSNGGVVLYNPTNNQNTSVASVLAHEILEMVGDRFANGWSDNGSTSYAQELCDPVEGDSYVINVGGVDVSVSNFIFPSFLNPQGTAQHNMPFDYLHKLTAPFTMSKNGYLIYRTGGPGTEQQIFGEEMAAWKIAIKKEKFPLKYPKQKKVSFWKKLFGR